MKKKNTPRTIPFVPDELTSIWNIAGEIPQEKLVSEQETEKALKNIWDSVDNSQVKSNKYPLKYLVAAVTLVGALVGFFNFFTLQKFSAPGETSSIILPDGSEIILNSNTSIEYNLLFGITNRNIKLNGHAHFDVQSNKNIPFIIESSSLTTTVIGTIFEIEDWKDSFDIVPKVLVHEGIVKVNNELNSTTLRQNDGIIFSNGDFKSTDILDSDYSQYFDWNDKRAHFKNITLQALFERLSLQFDTTIEVQGNYINNEKVSGSYRFGVSVEEILLDISTMKNLNFKRTNNGFIILK